MLGPDVAVAEPARLVDREIDGLLRVGIEADLARLWPVSANEARFDRLPKVDQLHPKPVQNARGHTLAFAYQSQQQVLRPDVVVIETDGLVLRESEHALGAVVEAIEGPHR